MIRTDEVSQQAMSFGELRVVADAWTTCEMLEGQASGIDKMGYEINFNRELFQCKTSHPLKEINAEQAALEQPILGLFPEVAE